MGHIFSRTSNDEQQHGGNKAAATTTRQEMAMAPKSNRQWTTALDGVDKLKLGDGDVPEPKDGEVLVQIRAVSLNYRDTEVCQGLYDHHETMVPPGTALVPCSDMCGTVTTSKSPLFKPGARVMSIFNQTHLEGALKEADMASGLGYPLPGVLTQYRCFPAKTLVAVPDYLTDEEASCLPIAAVTAWMSLNWMRPLGQHIGTKPTTKTADKPKPETVLLQGTGGVSISGLQIARAAGLRTIITSSSDDKLKRAKADLGADHGINYRTHWEWQDPVMEHTEQAGADIVFETGGTRTLRKSFACVAFGGVINCIGYLSGKNDDGSDDDGKNPQLHRLNVNILALRRNVTLKGIVNAGKDRFEEMLGFYKEKKIRPVVCKVFKFEEAKEAIQFLQSGEHFGKVVVKVAGDDGG